MEEAFFKLLIKKLIKCSKEDFCILSVKQVCHMKRYDKEYEVKKKIGEKVM